jgi:hypothetical protein
MTLKEIIPNLNMPVMWEGHLYTLYGSRVRKDKRTGELVYTAEILDKNQNSVCHVGLEEVTLVKENF